MSVPVATDVLWPVQAAFYARLTADEQLADLLGSTEAFPGVYDEVLKGAPYPHIVHGQAIETPRNAHGRFGSEVLLTEHVWTRDVPGARGFKKGLAIVARLRALFDHQPLTVEGHVVVSVRLEQIQTLRDPNPEIRHLPVSFRITTEQE